MIDQIYTYFNIDMLYLWLNIGVLPFWIILIFFPSSKVCKIFVSSIFPLIILSSVYIFLVFEILKNEFNFFDIFNLYLGLDELRSLLGNKNYLIVFWIHFLSINLFSAGWITKDSQKYLMPKFLTLIPLVITYFIGPLGIVIYWIFKIFFSKKISLYE
tara:strand:+ start:67 stop:540 length:474 start_codon:yes stop_codon:yes gene_type:complete